MLMHEKPCLIPSLGCLLQQNSFSYFRLSTDSRGIIVWNLTAAEENQKDEWCAVLVQEISWITALDSYAQEISQITTFDSFLHEISQITIFESYFTEI